MDTKSETHFPVLGNKQFESFKHLDLSTNGSIAKVSKKNWYQVLTDLANEKTIYFGGYLEKRFFYSNESLFGKGMNKRDIHLGVDLWVPAHTKIYAPYDSIVHSVMYNDKKLDYGHTIILKHNSDSKNNYSLYGHLSASHVQKIKPGITIKKGEAFCQIGEPAENGGWPPHLHLQLIQDIEENIGDYPGVASQESIDFYKNNCPDPTYLMNHSSLEC